MTSSADWTERFDFCAGVTDGKMFLYGGDDRSNDMWVSADGQSWEVVTTTVTAGGSIPGMAAHRCIKFNNSIFILGSTREGTYTAAAS